MLRDFTTLTTIEEPSTTVARFKKILTLSTEQEASTRFTTYLHQVLMKSTPNVMHTFDTFCRCQGELPRDIPTLPYCARVLMVLPRPGSKVTNGTSIASTKLPECTHHPWTSGHSTAECRQLPSPFERPWGTWRPPPPPEQRYGCPQTDQGPRLPTRPRIYRDRESFEISQREGGRDNDNDYLRFD